MFSQLAQTAVIFNTMRILKKVNQGDTYYEAYLGHYKKSGPEFYDLYHKLWELGSHPNCPKRILEIGTRTGISMCQLLSAYIDPSVIERIVCVDPFNDGYTSSKLVMANLKYLNLPWDKIHFKIGYSQDVLPQLLEAGETFDFILVDGDHSRDVARLDLENAHKLLEKNGILLFDDISDAPGECGLIVVWEEFKKAHENEYYTNESLSGKGLAWGVKK